MMPEILKLAGEGKVDPYPLVALHAIRDEKEAAFEWFAKALQEALKRGQTEMTRERPGMTPCWTRFIQITDLRRYCGSITATRCSKLLSNVKRFSFFSVFAAPAYAAVLVCVVIRIYDAVI